MLKKAINFVLGSKTSSTYPTREKSRSWPARGRVGEEHNASGFFSPAASLTGLFEPH